MSRENINSKQGELSILNQVLDTFFSIDKKVVDLHQCSSDDFLSLNRALKENHEKANYITQNVLLAFEKIGEEGNLRSLTHIRQNLSHLKEEILSFENEINDNLGILERVQANFSLMFVPINNFRQNLNSLKLLLSNIKLTNTYFDKSLKSFSEEEALKIETVINKVKDACPVFEENIYNIQQHLKTLYEDLIHLKGLIYNDVLEKLERVQQDFDLVYEHNIQAVSKKAQMDEIAKNCRSNVGSIITNLQYHDIIRQKMDHIRQTHKLIIDELNDDKPGEKETTSTTNPFFLQIPQIIEVQTAQLLHTNNEYQHAIDHISKKLVEMGQDMTGMTRIYSSVSVLDETGKKRAKEKMTGSFQTLLREKKKCFGRFRQMSDDLILVQRIVKELFEKFMDLEMMENAIEQKIIDKISFGNLLLSEEIETASQAQQIMKLYANNHFEKNKIRTLFENTQSQLNEFARCNTAFKNEKKGVEKINQLIQTADDNFESVKENFSFLEDIQSDLIYKSNQVKENSIKAVAGVKYYAFFEKTIEELIKKFDAITSIINKYNQVSYNQSVQKKGLEEIEKYYTMKSERIIHNQSILKQAGMEKLKDFDNIGAGPNSDQGNDVEFF